MPSDVFRKRLTLALILALALLLRLVGIGFGLPDLYHADEPIVVNHALAYGAGDWNPHFFKIPPFVSYLLFLLYGFYFLVSRAFGHIKGIDDFQQLFLTDPSSFYLLGRVLFGAILGTLTVYALYRLIRKFFSEDRAVLSAFFLSIAFLHVRDSHYIYVDIPLTLVLVLCFFPILQILDDGRRKDYVIFGVLFGIAVATKYNGVFIFVPWIASHCLRKSEGRSAILTPDLFLAAAVSVGTYAVLNPFGWLDFRFFLNELLGQSQAEGFSGFLHHILYSLNGGIGFSLLTLSALGIGLILFGVIRTSASGLLHDDKKRLIVLSFVAVYYLVLCFFSQPYDRYVLPLIPFLIFFAADGFIRLKAKLNLSDAVGFALACVMALPSLSKVCLSDYLFARKDTRTIARGWVERSIGSGAKIALDSAFYMPRLKPTLTQLSEKKEEILAAKHFGKAQLKRIELMTRQAKRDQVPRYELFFLKGNPADKQFLFSKPSVPYDVGFLKNSGIEYVVIGQIAKGHGAKFYSDLDNRAELLARFSPYKDQFREWPIDGFPLTGGPFLWDELIARQRNGPVIKAYRLK